MSTPPPEQVEFRIVSQTFDSWNVQFQIEVSELLDQQCLLRHLRQIKQRIAKAHSLPESSMLFDGIVHKEQTEESMDVVVKIKRILFEKGSPRVHFRDGIGTDNTRYSMMTALLDIFYLDPFEKPITLDAVTKATQEAMIPANLLDDSIITRKLQEVLEKHLPIKNIPIAKGKFPDIGMDAELEFYFQAVVEPGQLENYYSSRKVSKGDLLCRKSPARKGKQTGRNVRGQELPPRDGLDIVMKTGSGAELSLDSTEVTAQTDGVVVVQRTMKRVNLVNGVKELPDSILIKVNPVLRVEGNQIVDINSSQSVEIIGDLCMGSRVLTDCEVYVSGNVEEGTLIQSADDVIVEGWVSGATIHSESNVVAGKDITDATITAKDQIVIKGAVRNSNLTADKVTADSVTGGRIMAQSSVTLSRIGTDENNLLSTICVGMNDFFSERIRENEAFIERARENLSRIEMLVGKDIMDQITGSNIQTMLMRFLSRHHMGQDAASRKQAATYRNLLEAVPPTRSLIGRKMAENIELARKLSERRNNSGGVVRIRERLAGKTILSVDGIEAEVDEINQPSEIRSDGETNLIVSRTGESGKGGGA